MLKRRRHQRGFSLVEVMVAVSILGIVASMVATFMGHMNESKRLLRKRAVRDAINARIAKAITTPANLSRSLPNPANAALRNCVNIQPNSGLNCRNRSISLDGNDNINLNNATPFVLLNAAGLPLSGTAAAPRFYGRNGSIGRHQAPDGTVSACNASSPLCPFQVRTYFWPSCPRQTMNPTCVQAETIHVAYEVITRQVQRMAGPKSARGDEVALTSTARTETSPTFAEPISTWAIAEESRYNCADPNAIMVGKTKNRTTGEIKAICKCQRDHQEINAPNLQGGVRCNPPVRDPCPPPPGSKPNSIMMLTAVGLGTTATCDSVQLDCRRRKFKDRIDCGLDSWIYTLQLAECEFSTSAKDPRPFVDCRNDENSAVCCSLR